MVRPSKQLVFRTRRDWGIAFLVDRFGVKVKSESNVMNWSPSSFNIPNPIELFPIEMNIEKVAWLCAHNGCVDIEFSDAARYIYWALAMYRPAQHIRTPMNFSISIFQFFFCLSPPSQPYSYIYGVCNVVGTQHELKGMLLKCPCPCGWHFTFI